MKVEEIFKDKNKLAQKMSKFTEKQAKYPCIVQEKYDGVFVFAVKDNNKCIFLSRTGEPYLSMNHLSSYMLNILDSAEKDIVLFEAYIERTPQAMISVFCRDKTNQHSELRAVVHDILSFEEYMGDKKTPYINRLDLLRHVVSLNPKSDKWGNDYIYLPKQITAHNITDIRDFAQQIFNKGGEGVVVKNPKMGYQRGKRNTNMMKLKQKISFDLKVVDVERGHGQFQNAVGALICQYSKGRTISVGSGLRPQDRYRFWTNRELIIGKIVEVEAMRLTESGLLREPIYKGIRYDKETPDF